MDDQNIDSIPALLRRYGIRPSKGLGQNFLVDPNILDRVIDAAEIQPEDQVLEVGPGLGHLTRHLAQKAKRVVAVELDKKFIPILTNILKPYPNVEIVQTDILDLNLGDYFTQPGYLVVANIPYYITSALLRHLLEAPHPPSRLTLTVQKEVAKRICAKPGKFSLLSLSVQVYGQPQTITTIPAGAFYPAPKVDSAVVRVDLYPEPLIQRENLEAFFTLVKAGFSQKRKMLGNALGSRMGWGKELAQKRLLAADIDPQRRAQTLTIEEWGRLVES